MAVKNKLNELALAGDQEETNRWKCERRDIVSSWIKGAGPIAAFLKVVEENHSAELTVLKNAREADIESHLLELGWLKGDFQCDDDRRMKQWSSLVYTAKPLTSQGWANLLPTWIPFLELNREERLRREAFSRLQDRRDKMRAWITAFLDQPKLFARIVGPAQFEAVSSTVSGSNGSHKQTISAPQGNDINQLSDIWKLKQSNPHRYILQGWPEIKTFQEKDITTEAFELDLEGMRLRVEELVQEWRLNLKQMLVGLLQGNHSPEPEDIKPLLVEDPLAFGSNLAKFTLSLGAGPPYSIIR